MKKQIQKILIKAKKLDKIVEKFIIDIDVDLYDTKHSDERLDRDKKNPISEEEVIRDVNKVLPYVLNDFANGEIDKNSYFLVHNKKTYLNVVCVLKMQKGKDFVKVITVMKKKNFKEKTGTKRYEI